MVILMIVLTSCDTFTSRARILDEIIDLNPETGEIYYYGHPWETWETLDLDQATTMIETLDTRDGVRLYEYEGDQRLKWSHRTFNTAESLFLDNSGAPILLNVSFNPSNANPHFSQIIGKLGEPDRAGIGTTYGSTAVEILYKFPDHIAVFRFSTTRVGSNIMSCQTTNVVSLSSYRLVRVASFEELEAYDRIPAVSSNMWFDNFEIDGEDIRVCR